MHFLFIFITLIIVFSLSLAKEGHSKVDQKVSCRGGQAISDIYWKKESDTYNTYFIQCENLTDTCREKCEYTAACEISHYGPDSYVRGIKVMYDNMQHNQKILYLCCNVSKSLSRECSGKEEKLTGTQNSDDGKLTSFRQAQSNSLSNEYSALSLTVEACYATRSNITLCPLAAMHSHMGVDPALAGLAGLAGLSGLAGIALLKKKAASPAPPGAPPPPACIPESGTCSLTSPPCCGGLTCEGVCY